MNTFKNLFLGPIAPELTLAEVASRVLIGAGIVAMVVGLMVMPSLQLTEGQFYIALLALVGFMVLTYIAAQVTTIANELKRVSSRSDH